jgi:hypothetical protein
LVLGASAALAAAAVTAGPAFGTNEYFECGSCGRVNAPENYIRNAQGINHSGTGACITIWWHMRNGQYQNEGSACAGGGGTATVCNAPYYPEFYGHGEVQSYGEAKAYIRGRQDNFTYCG